MNELEQKGVISVCILAAFADGSQSEAERAQVQKIAEGFHQNPMLASAYQDVLGQQLTLAGAAQALQTQEARNLAYEMAVCVCNADGLASEDEKRFLEKLRAELNLDSGTSPSPGAHLDPLAQVTPLAAPPILAQAMDQNIEKMIVNCAILTGALELLPHSLATMAIIPVQIRMVYRIGQQHGFELNRGHVQDFLATVGVGLTSQVVEGFARKLIGNLSRSIGGGLLGGMAGTATGSAVAFGTTYALGQVANLYYAQGRTLDATQLRQVFSSMLSKGNSLQQQYTSQIVDKSRQIQMKDLLPLVKQSS